MELFKNKVIPPPFEQCKNSGLEAFDRISENFNHNKIKNIVVKSMRDVIKINCAHFEGHKKSLNQPL